MSNPLDKYREAVALARRQTMRLVGTPQQEAARKLAEALVNGATLHVRPEIEAGNAVTFDNKIYFHSQAEQDAFVAALNGARPR